MAHDETPFLLREGPLSPGHAVVALILVEGSRYLMQLRDNKPGIFFPGHWGLFGGAIDPGETPEDALRRELEEELDFAPRDMRYFSEFMFDFAPHGGERLLRRYYEIHVAATEVESMVLGEGAALRLFEADDLLRNRPVTPYDAFAIWMHATRVAHGRNQVPKPA